MNKREYLETTEAQFKLFKKNVSYWIDFFGIKDADIEVSHELINDLGDHASCADGDTDNRYFEITLEKEPIGSEGFTDDYINMSAAHEVLEILFMPLRNKAVNAGAVYEAIDEDIHRIIRTIENTCLRPIIDGNKKCSGDCSCSKK